MVRKWGLSVSVVGRRGGSRGSREKGGKAMHEPGQRVRGYLEHFVLIQHGQERELILRAGKLHGELLARACTEHVGI